MIMGKEQIGSIRKKIFTMILPITVENILETIASLVSMAIIGRIDTVSVGAIGLSSRVTQMVWALFKGISTGAAVLVAQSFGAGDFDRLRKVVQQSLLSALILVIALGQLIYWKAPALLSIFNPSENLMKNSLIYLRTVSWGLPFMVIMIVTAGVLQGMGNAKTPMKISLMMNIANIALAYSMVFGKFGFSAMGIRGAAVAMVIAQFIGAAADIYVLFCRNGIMSNIFNRSFFRMDLKQIGEVYRVGIPSSLESVFWQVAAVLLTMMMLKYGETAYAAYQLGLQAESISYMPALGFGVAATTFIGQCLGAGEGKTGKLYMKELIKGSLAVTVVAACALIFLPKPIMRLLTNDGDVVKLGAIYLVLMGFVQIPQNISGVLDGALRGAGYTRVPMIVAAAGLWGVRIPMSFVLTHYFDLGITSIWVVICVDLVFRFILSIILYRSRNIYDSKPVFEMNGVTIKA